MNEQPYTVARLEELDTITLPNQPAWHRIRLGLGIEAFGVNAWTASEPGQELIGEHDELGDSAGGHEELYAVLSGRATFTVAGETLDCAAGTLVFVRDPAARRSAVAEEADTTVLVAGGTPRQAFAPSEWELDREFLRYFETGEYEKAIADLSARAADRPDNAGVLYNLACAESLAGRREDAVAHLRRAVELDSRFGEYAQEDSDFDPVRDDPEFPGARPEGQA